jgi:tetratricopeptide (TPR) repeat protein
MRRLFLDLKRLGFLQCLFLFFTPILSDSIQIGNETFSKNLEMREEIALATPGSFYLNPNDFVIAAGKQFQGEPPGSRASFSYEGKKIENLGAFNNEAIAILEKREKDSFSKAESMLSAGVDFDPLFFPTRYNLARVLEMNGYPGEAKDQFLKASRIIPAYYRTFLHLGILEYKLSRHLEASEYLRKAVRLDKFREDAKSILCSFAFTSGYTASYKRFIKEKYPTPLSISQKTCEAARYNHENKFSQTHKIMKKTTDSEYQKELHYPRYIHLLYLQAAEKVGDVDGMEVQVKKILESPFDWVFLFVEEKTLFRKLEVAGFLKKNRMEEGKP